MKHTREYQKWIRWLGDVIERECAKSEDEADMGLVEECEALLCDLVTAEEGTVTLTPTILHARLDDIKARGHFLPGAPRRIRRIPAQVGKIAACVALAAVVGIGGALATVTALSGRTQTDLPPVEGTTAPVSETEPLSPTVSHEGIRYQSLGKTADYENIETLLAAQALEIPYPTALPEGVTITEVSVDVTAEPAVVTYGFSEPTLRMTVTLNTAADEGMLSAVGEPYAAGEMTSYLCATEDGYRATVVGDGTVAVVESLSRETVTAVLDGMAQSKPVRVLGMSMDTYDGYLFFVEVVHYKYRQHKVIRRLDPRTGEISSPCVSETCGHDTPDCPFFGGGPTMGFQLFGEWILINEQYYWNTENLNSSGTLQARYLYNLKTGEYRKVPAVLRNTNDIIRVGDRLYMVRRSDGLDYADGTRRYYSRVYEYDLNTADYRIVYEHNDTIRLIYGGNTRIYFKQEVGTDEVSAQEFYSFNPETGEMRTEPTLSLKNAAYVYRNRVYQRDVNMSTGVTTVTAHDVTTGETEVVLQDYLNGSFFLHEEGIYYIRMDELGPFYEERERRSAALDAAYDEALAAKDDVRRNAISAERSRLGFDLSAEMLLPYNMEIWSCDFHGGNRVKICEIPCVSVSGFMVDGNMLYAYATWQDRVTGEDLSRDGRNVPIAVDMTSGETTVLTPGALK